MQGSTTRRRASQRRSAPALGTAAAGSLALHALLLVLVVWVLPRLGAGAAGLLPSALLAIPAAEIQADDALDSVELAEVSPENLPPWPVPSDLPEADSAFQDSRPATGQEGIVGETRPLATDSGTGAGRNLPLAHRKDASTLRARLSSGARVYQPSREKTSRVASSPEARRRERKIGVGDSARTETPSLAQTAPPEPVLPEEELSQDEVSPPLEDETRVPVVAGEDRRRGDGAIEADRGARAFDEQVQGPARDRLDARAASNETNPGLIDYAAVSARGSADPALSTANRGPGVAPGVTTVVTTGTASAAGGYAQARPLGEAGQGTAERQYDRDILEIQRRVGQFQRFPRQLALMLEQGEAVVVFQVFPDGRVGGDVKLLKSAGFEDFDREALDVVRRAAPYPRRARPLLVRLRIAFENPLVR